MIREQTVILKRSEMRPIDAAPATEEPPPDGLPKGYVKVPGAVVYYDGQRGRLIITGEPNEEQDPDGAIHNCDAMGCNWEHVLYFAALTREQAGHFDVSMGPPTRAARVSKRLPQRMTKTHSIPFSPAMRAAIRDGRKTVTRRLMRPKQAADFRAGKPVVSPYAPGDILLVGEPWRTIKSFDGLKPSELHGRASIRFEDDGATGGIPGIADNQWGRYRNARFLPLARRRLRLTVLSSRAESLQAITPADAKAEGIPTHVEEHTFIKCYRDQEERDAQRVAYFRDLWDSLNLHRATWASNPPIWRHEFALEPSL